MTSCTISSLMASGMRRHWGQNCWFRPIALSGDRSVGVAPQYASSLGKTANCQTLVSLTLARGEVPVMVALRLFVPESWTSNPVRLKRAGVPVEHRAARTKPEIALAEIDRVIAAGARFGCVLAAGQCQVAKCELAKRYQGSAGSSLRRCSRANRRWATSADRGHGPAASSGGRSLAHRRTQDVGREEILSRQSAGQDEAARVSCHDQSPMDLRTGPSAVERGTRA